MSTPQPRSEPNVQNVLSIFESYPDEIDEHADPTGWMLQNNWDDFAVLEELKTSRAIFVPPRLTDN